MTNLNKGDDSDNEKTTRGEIGRENQWARMRTQAVEQEGSKNI